MGECERNSYIIKKQTNPTNRTEYSSYPSSSSSPSSKTISSFDSNSVSPNQDFQQYAKNQGVLVKRCRILEESKCASICINSCKITTQQFFQKYMGMNLTMVPNFETGECQ